MKAVVAHRGARDSYQVALALQEAGLLDRLYTDLYWSAERPWAQEVEKHSGEGVKQALRARHQAGLDSSLVRMCPASGLTSFALDKAKGPFALRKMATRWTDAEIGLAAGRRARKVNSAILSYSYYGFTAFTEASRTAPKILFQLHPHPASVRTILARELERHPECAASLGKEWELALPEREYNKLVEEVLMADHWIAASSFTRSTLVENGVPKSRVHVVPYGVHLDRFTPAPDSLSRDRSKGPLKILFVGTINQRKGIRYLLNALCRFRPEEVELLVCGRAVDDLSLFRDFGSQTRVRVSVSNAELLEAYRSADLFVFPSIAEGFGHVLLEALACGLPILSTTSTAAPDLIRDGEAGFIVDPAQPDQIFERIAGVLHNRHMLTGMSAAARRTAEHYTWKNFRSQVADAVGQILLGTCPKKESHAHV